VGVAVAPNGGRVYVTNSFSNTVSVINTATNALVATISVGEAPWGVAVDPGGTHVFVSNSGFLHNVGGFDPHTVYVIDTSSNTVVTSVPSVGQHPIGLVATASNVYVAHTSSDIVSVIDI
jgi:YVTN family beta-propeller protein